jgi:hypothetical protein
MRLVRGLFGAVVWILAAVLGLVGVLLCVTVILLPLGIPVVKCACKLFARAIQLFLPHALAHPVHDLTRAAETRGRKVRSAVSDSAKKGRKAARKQRKHLVA